MYKKKDRNFAWWTVTESFLGAGKEKKKNNNQEGKVTIKTNYGYCLLLLERERTSTPKFVVVCFFYFLPSLLFFLLLLLCFSVCAVSTDSYKVGKCRIACCSCLSTGRETKKNKKTHTHAPKLRLPLFENASSTHTFDRNVSSFVNSAFFFFLGFLLTFFFCLSVLGWNQSRRADTFCVFV